MRRLALLAVLVGLAACADPRAQEHQARTFVFETLSTPERPVTVGPVVQRAGYAMVDWTRLGAGGGRALLRRQGSGWAFALCGGEPLKRPEVLAEAGMPKGAAEEIVKKLLVEEERVDQRRRDQLGRWTGLGVDAACPLPKTN